MSKLKHFDNLGTARFVTFSCFRYRKLLTEDNAIIIFMDELDKARTKHNLAVLGYVIMPNHVHLVLYPKENIKLGPVIGIVKAQTGKRILKKWRKERPGLLENLWVLRNQEPRYVFWQRRCYDHNCRTIDAVREKINYCHMNPVKAGLVSDPDDWPWSSYRWYHGNRDSIVHVDDIELYV
jgi:putative transposase